MSIEMNPLNLAVQLDRLEFLGVQTTLQVTIAVSQL